MLAETHHYRRLFEKEAQEISSQQADRVGLIMKEAFLKEASALEFIRGIDPLVAGAATMVPAYMLGKSMGKDEEKSNIPKYLLGGAAAGFALPKLLSLATPSSMMGFDSEDIKEFKRGK